MVAPDIHLIFYSKSQQSRCRLFWICWTFSVVQIGKLSIWSIFTFCNHQCSIWWTSAGNNSYVVPTCLIYSFQRQHCYTGNDLHNSVCLAPRGSNTNSRSHISNLFNLDSIPGWYVFIIQDRYPGPDVDMVVCPGVIYRQQPLSRILFCFSQRRPTLSTWSPPTISPEVSKCQVWKSWQLFGNIWLWTPIWGNWHNSRKWRSVRKNLF